MNRFLRSVRPSRRDLTIAGLSCIAAALATNIAMTDPNDQEDPQPRTSFVCDEQVLPTVKNGTGFVLAPYREFCGLFGGTTIVLIYLLAPNQVRSRVNLVARLGEAEDPVITWIDEGHAIVALKDVYSADKTVSRLFGISLTFVGLDWADERSAARARGVKN